MDVAFFDIDNTLTSRDSATGWGSTISPATAEAIRAFCAKGNIALLSTGRAPQGVPACIQELPFSGMVAFDGSLALFEGERVYERFIGEEDLEAALALSQETGMGLLFSGLEGRAFSGARHGFEWHAETIFDMAGLRRLMPSLEVGKLAFRHYDLPIYQASDLLQERFTCYQSAPDYFELVCKGVGKDVAAHALIDAIAQKKGRPGRVLAFGDSANDIPLLKCVDLPVVMGNGTEDAKSVAAMVTDDVMHDGVAHALRRLGYL